MTGSDIVKMVRDSGFSIRFAVGDLKVSPTPPPELITVLRTRKPEVLATLLCESGDLDLFLGKLFSVVGKMWGQGHPLSEEIDRLVTKLGMTEHSDQVAFRSALGELKKLAGVA